MTDAPGPSTGKKPADSAGKRLDGKKRFEVKKVDDGLLLACR